MPVDDLGKLGMRMLYLSCPPKMQETLLNNTKRLRFYRFR